MDSNTIQMLWLTEKNNKHKWANNYDKILETRYNNIVFVIKSKHE